MLYRQKTTENGYVTSVGYNGKTHAYTYDGAGRLTSETINGSTTTYTYDTANNILKAGFEYTNGVLTSVNGKEIIYDEMGNPTIYKDNTLMWGQGRKLVSGEMNGKDFVYRYDGNGMRYEKTVDGIKTEYCYDGDRLLLEIRNGKRKHCSNVRIRRLGKYNVPKRKYGECKSFPIPWVLLRRGNRVLLLTNEIL